MLTMKLTTKLTMKCFNWSTLTVKHDCSPLLPQVWLRKGDAGSCTLQASSRQLYSGGAGDGESPRGSLGGGQVDLLGAVSFLLFFCPPLPRQIGNLPPLPAPAARVGDNGSQASIPAAGTTNRCGHQGELSYKEQTSIRERQGADTGLWEGFWSFPLMQRARSIVGSASHIFPVKYHSRSDSVNKYSGRDCSVS